MFQKVWCERDFKRIVRIFCNFFQIFDINDLISVLIVYFDFGDVVVWDIQSLVMFFVDINELDMCCFVVNEVLDCLNVYYKVRICIFFFFIIFVLSIIFNG